MGFLLLSASSLTAQGPVFTLTPSSYHGYNISCFGSQDGVIDLSVSGGTAPYTYRWSNSATTQDINGLAAGYYRVDVTDHDNRTTSAEITLQQPLAMRPNVDVYEYPNGYNVSCFGCSNGNAAVVVTGGAAPFTYAWEDGPTEADRYNLGPQDYKVTVTDANGCTSDVTTIYLRQPDRSDWSMEGNSGSNPASQYIGTSDAKDLVFKSNGAERLRLKSNGDIGLWGADTTVGMLYRDVNGILKGGTIPIGPWVSQPPLSPCNLLYNVPWTAYGNNFGTPCTPPKLGTLSNQDVILIANGQERMRVTTDGKVGIGTNDMPNDDYSLFVAKGILTEKVKVALRNTDDWSDYVFQSGYALMPLRDVDAFIKEHGHLPGVPSATTMVEQGLDVAKMDAILMEKVEELTLHLISMEERIAHLELENARLRSLYGKR